MDLKSLFRTAIGFHDKIVESHNQREPEIVGKLAYYGKPWLDMADQAKHASPMDMINAIVPDPVAGLHASAQALAKHEYGKALALGMGSTPFGSIGILPYEQLAQLKEFAAKGEIPPPSLLQHPNEPKIGTTYHGTNFPNAQDLDAMRKPDLGKAGEIWGNDFSEGGLHGKAFYTTTSPVDAFSWGRRAAYQADNYAAPVVFKAKFPTNTVINENDMLQALHARLQSGKSIEIPGATRWNEIHPETVTNASELGDLLDPAHLPSLAQKYFGAKGLSTTYGDQGHVVFPDVTDVRVKPMFKGDPQVEDPAEFHELSSEVKYRRSSLFYKYLQNKALDKVIKLRGESLNALSQ